MDHYIYYIGLFLLLLIPMISADIISINGGGTENMVINPDKYIEGIFFESGPSEVITVTPGVAGGGPSPVGENLTLLLDIDDIWYFNNINIMKIEFFNQTQYVDVGSIYYEYNSSTIIDIEEKNLHFIDVGIYEQGFEPIYDTMDFRNVTVTVNVIYFDKIYSNSIDAQIVRPTWFQQSMFDLFNRKPSEMTKLFTAILIIAIFIIVLMIVVLIVLSKRDGRNNNSYFLGESKNK